MSDSEQEFEFIPISRYSKGIYSSIEGEKVDQNKKTILPKNGKEEVKEETTKNTSQDSTSSVQKDKEETINAVEKTQLKKLSKLGYGSYSEIWKCLCEKKFMVAKFFWKLPKDNRNKPKNNFFENEREYYKIVETHCQNEFNALLLLGKCKYTSNLFFMMENDSYWILCMKYFFSIELITFLTKTSCRPIKEEYMKRDPGWRLLFRKLLLGLQSIHYVGIIHNDIKCENILLEVDADHPQHLQIRYIDFGFSYIFRNQENDLMIDNTAGTYQYLAPEKIFFEAFHGQPVDVFSLGVVFFCIHQNRFPWSAEERKKFIPLCRSIIDHPPVYHDVLTQHSSSPTDHFIKELVAILPGDRLTISEALEHPFVTEKLPSQTVDLNKRKSKSY